MKFISAIKISLITLLATFAVSIYAASTASSNPVTFVNDSVITGAVKAKIATDKHLSVLDIQVTTINGVVMLAGTVNSDSEASELIQLTQSTTGVKDVNAAKIYIKESSQPFTDIAISAKIKGLFLREKLVGTQDISVISINVETKNGVVYLSGTADNKAQEDTAIAIAQSVVGVVRVDSTIKIKHLP